MKEFPTFRYIDNIAVYDHSENTFHVIESQKGNESETEYLVEANSALVYKLARKFTGRGVEYEDLCQIGMLGLLHAIRTFDTGRGTAFSTYAVPLIIGEIKRFLRDDGTVKVGRKQKRDAAVILRAIDTLTYEYGREPHINEICARCSLSAEEVYDALEASHPVQSLNAPLTDDDSLSLEDTLSCDDTTDNFTEKIALRESISKMPPLWRKIIILRYFRDYSQSKTAEMLGLTQVKVSREEKKIFASLRGELVV